MTLYAQSSGHNTTQQLAAYLDAISQCDDEASAVTRGVELAAEALDAEVGALVRDGRVECAIGYASGRIPEREILSAVAGRRQQLVVPGAGGCQVFTASTGTVPAGYLLVARSGEDPFGLEEASLLRAMARSLALTLRTLSLLDNERSLRYELQERQTLLERLSRILRSISHRAPLQEVLDTLVAGAGDLFEDPVVAVRLIDEDDPNYMLMVSHRGIKPEQLPSLMRMPLGAGAGGRAILEERLIVLEEYADNASAIPLFVEARLHAAMSAPISENGVVVGSITVATYKPGRTYSPAEQDMLLAFAEHASLALTDAKMVARMHHQAFHDALTGLPNRVLFLDRLDRSLARARREVGSRVAVAFVDLDRFKNVNDSLGHDHGDMLLTGVGERLRDCLREVDTAARMGGDEFALLIEEPSDSEDAHAVTNRALEALRAPFTISGREIFVTASAGVAVSENGLESAAELLRNADLAMYRAKLDSARLAVAFEPDMHTAAVRRLELEADLQRAVDAGDFEVHYQPVIELDSGRMVGVEALARWIHPTRGVIMPAEFIHIAEDTGLILQLGRYVLQTAVAQARTWEQRLGPDRALSVSVNLSATQLMEPEVATDVREILESSGLDPALLALEITETVLMRDTTATVSRLEDLKRLGVKLEIDDFGTGYSSFGYLRRFPLDVLKIDRTFVDGLATRPENLALTQAITTLAAALGLSTVAEGIETEEQARLLRSLGCTLGQGYLFSRPVPASRIDQVLGHGGFIMTRRRAVASAG